MGAERTGTDFAAELARLKRRGSAVLVRDAGEGFGVCTDLLGSDEERRRRVLARATDAAVLPVPPGGATVVDVTPADSRSATARNVSAFDPETVAHRVEATEDVDAVTAAVSEAVDRVVDGGVRPGELRVCLGRLDPHLERGDAAAVADAVDSLMNRVRDCDGMGHAHLAIDPPPVLEPVFDVTVETRTTEAGFRQQRWHLHATGIDTGWLQMRAR